MKNRKRGFNSQKKKMIFIATCCITILFFISAFFSEQGLLELYERRDHLAKVQTEMEEFEEKNKWLSIEVKRLGNDSYVEQVARESLGLLKKNEIFIVLDE